MTAFFEFLATGGLFFTLPLTIFAIIVLVLSVKSGLELFVAGRVVGQRASKNLDAIIYLGGFSFVFGVFGQIIGLYEAFGHIAKVGSVSQKILMQGLRVSTISTLYGFAIFLVSSVLWFVLRNKLKSIIADKG